MTRNVGTVSRGIRCPIIREGDPLPEIVANSIVEASQSDSFKLYKRDIVAVTESIVARAQGNYVHVDAIAKDVKEKLGGGTIGVVFPVLSRNRFATCLRGIAMGAKKIVLQLSYPADEVGNHLITLDQLDESGVNPYSDVLSLADFRRLFGYPKHEFTGVDYVSYYEEIIKDAGAECEIVFSNNCKTILDYTDSVLSCDIHTRVRSKRILREHGAKIVCGLDDILTEAIDGSGYNREYGLLGSNTASSDSIKLFPRDCSDFVTDTQKRLLELTGKHFEVMVYGDGAFKDPQGKIWELADPVVSPAYTDGLQGTPHELKLKYLADNDFKDLSGEELTKAVAKTIREKDEATEERASLGTTPRQLPDLVGSLADLTSGSGDKGTPIVLIQGYFDNYTN